MEQSKIRMSYMKKDDGTEFMLHLMQNDFVAFTMQDEENPDSRLAIFMPYHQFREMVADMDVRRTYDVQ